MEDKFNTNLLRIAIDGPAASGKGTVAKALAKRLNLFYVGTGAIFRALAVLASKLSVEVDESTGDGFCDLIREHAISISQNSGGVEPHMLLDGEDVTGNLRNPNITKDSSKLGATPCVQQFVKEWLATNVIEKRVVMEGRNVGTTFLPDAELKIFLTASLEERAMRRLKQYQSRGRAISLDEVQERLFKRDLEDKTRQYDPLRPSDGAVTIDSTNMSVDEVVEQILTIVKEENLQ